MSQSKVRIGGSGFTVMTWQGQRLAYLQTLGDQAPQPVAAAEAIQPIDEEHPIEIVTAQAVRAGTLTLQFYEVWTGPVWSQLPGFEGTNNLLDVLKRQLELGTITCRKIIKVPGGAYRTRVYNNCWRGDTRFATKGGTKTLAETAGTAQMVLGSGGEWTPAEIREFGEQELLTVTLTRYGRRKVLHATAGHRWFKREGRSRVESTTTDLIPGDKLVSVYKTPHLDRVRLSAIGVQAGIVFGDGTLDGKARESSRVDLIGAKEELLKWFPLSPTRNIDRKDGTTGISAVDLPGYFKRTLAPLDESLGYLYGWLAGYFATDGCVDKQGSPSLSSANLEHLRHAQDVCHRLGIRTTGITSREREGFGKLSILHHLRLSRFGLPEEFFLRTQHRERVLVHRAEPKIADWVVESVVETGLVEPVYCAVVPDGQAFTLEDNILSGNCVVVDFDESENVNIGSLSLPKNIRIQYTHTSTV